MTAVGRPRAVDGLPSAAEGHEADPTAEFFGRVDRRSRQVLSARHSGTIRLDLTCDDHVEHWFLTVDHGEARVSREDRDADCVLVLDKPLFDCLAAGEAQFGPYLFRGRFQLRGSFRAFAMLRRMLPDLKGARDPRTLAPPRGLQP